MSIEFRSVSERMQDLLAQPTLWVIVPVKSAFSQLRMQKRMYLCGAEEHLPAIGLPAEITRAAPAYPRPQINAMYNVPTYGVTPICCLGHRRQRVFQMPYCVGRYFEGLLRHNDLRLFEGTLVVLLHPAKFAPCFVKSSFQRLDRSNSIGARY